MSIRHFLSVMSRVYQKTKRLQQRFDTVWWCQSRHLKTGHASCHSLLSSFASSKGKAPVFGFARHLPPSFICIHFYSLYFASNDSPRQLVLFQILGGTIATGTLSVALGLAGPTTIATGAQGDGAPGAGQGSGGGTEVVIVVVVVHVEMTTL